MALQLLLLCASASIALRAPRQDLSSCCRNGQEKAPSHGACVPQVASARPARWGCDLAPSVPGPGPMAFTGARGWAEASGLSGEAARQ